MDITIGHLYPHTMSTYGDSGNIACLRRRCEWRGICVNVLPLEIGDPVPGGIDLYFFGGGQDAAQGAVGRDLVTVKADRIREDAAAGVPMLAICGGYQLLGTRYLPSGADPIPGLGILPVETAASKGRMIGNLVITATESLYLDGRTTIVGFENHSGKTSFTDASAVPLGRVRSGHGNNGGDGSEGCVAGGIIGCYLHGSLLPKNPHLADWLLARALARRGVHTPLAGLDDTAEWAAHDAIVNR